MAATIRLGTIHSTVTIDSLKVLVDACLDLIWFILFKTEETLSLVLKQWNIVVVIAALF